MSPSLACKGQETNHMIYKRQTARPCCDRVGQNPLLLRTFAADESSPLNFTVTYRPVNSVALYAPWMSDGTTDVVRVLVGCAEDE